MTIETLSELSFGQNWTNVSETVPLGSRILLLLPGRFTHIPEYRTYAVSGENSFVCSTSLRAVVRPDSIAQRSRCGLLGRFGSDGYRIHQLAAVP